ncbi:MAG: hypothetical protein ACFFCV_12745 [Promethearchaeota archaeon]
MISETEREKKQEHIGTVENYIIGVILLIVGIIVLVLGIPLLFFSTIVGDLLQTATYNAYSTFLVLLGIYISLFGLQFLLQKLNKSIKAYLLITAGISIIILMILSILFAFLMGISPKILESSIGLPHLGLFAYIFLGFGSIIYGAYSLSNRYTFRKNLVYGNIVAITILFIFVLIFGISYFL